MVIIITTMPHQRINSGFLTHRLPNVAFSVFREWTRKAGVDTPPLKSEQTLVDDLRRVIGKAIEKLEQKDVTDQPPGWAYGYFLGFASGNLSSHWWHEYITKQSDRYKSLMALKAVIVLLEQEDVLGPRLDALFAELMIQNAPVREVDVNVLVRYFDADQLQPGSTDERGGVLTILQNLVVEHVEALLPPDTVPEIDLEQYLSTDEFSNLLAALH